MSKKYFAYLRVSDDKYEQSIDNQKEIIYQTAEKLGIDKENIEIIEEKLSGSSDTVRPLFDRMLETLFQDYEKNKNNVAKREYGGIFCFKIDRLARNDKDFVRLFKLLDAGYSFYSATETIEDTPTWRLLFRMLCSFAIFESEKLSNRISLAQLHHLLQEKFVNLWGSTAIFWYKIVHNWKSKKEWEFIVEPSEATVVQEVYDTYLKLTDLNPHKKPPTYVTVYDNLSERSKYVITQYRENRNKDTTTNIDDFIARILKNDHMMGYNGVITREIAINDELIKTYLEVSLPQAQSEFLITEWEGMIGTKMKFVFYMPQFTIINDFLYDNVHHINSTHWVGKWNRYKHNYKGIFHQLLAFQYGKNAIKDAYAYQAKWTRQYKRDDCIPWKSVSISEKKLLNEIEMSPYIRLLKPLLVKHRKEIETNLQPMIASQYQQQVKKATGRINLYQHCVDKTLEDINLTTGDDREYYLKMYDHYSEILQSEIAEKERLQAEKVAIIKEYLLLFKVDTYSSRWEYEKFIFFHSTLEKVVYHTDRSWTTKLILHPRLFIQEYLQNEWLNPIITLDI